jgi:tripartite motif-containing protein 71
MATTYNIYWSLNSPVTLSSTKITDVTSPYDHTNLTNGITYYYAATVYNGVDESDLSNEIALTPRPNPPTLISAVGGNKQTTEVWIDNP